MSTDRIEKLGHSLIQHGPESDRVYLMKLGAPDLPELAENLVEMARDRGYTKIFTKVPAALAEPFRTNNYVEEARIPNLFGREGDGLFMSRYLSSERAQEERPDQVKKVLAAARDKGGRTDSPQLGAELSCRMMCKADVEEMTCLYQEVFASYPFPIHDPDYLAETMDGNVLYFGVWLEDRLVALSSAEIDFDNRNAEMTDFATLPEFRGQGLASFLLNKMESGIRQIGIRTAYTIARAYSFGMNITFARQGYHHGGTLVKNTQISGGLETMNIWYKHL